MPYSIVFGVLQGAEEDGVKIKQSTKDTLINKIVSLFHEKKVIDQYIEIIAHTLTQSEYEFILAWYNSELGRRMTVKDVFDHYRLGYAQLEQEKNYISNNTAIAENTRIYGVRQ